MKKISSFKEVKRSLDTCANYGIKIGLGDLNSDIGNELVLKRYIGTHSLKHIIKDNELCHEPPDFVIISRQDHFHQINHTLIVCFRLSNSMNMRTYRKKEGSIESHQSLAGLRFYQVK